jgi:hypothetical protein
MLKMIKDYIDEGGEAVVNWFIKTDDDVMKEEVEDLREESELPIRVIFE